MVTVRSLMDGETEPTVVTVWEDWGELDPAGPPDGLERWAVEWTRDGHAVVVGHLSAHPVRYGPTVGSRAMNIGISLVEEARGRGIGATAQRLLADLLHDRGVVRVEASTDVENEAEKGSLSKAGFSLEGVLRQAQVRQDGRHDLQMWSHIRRP